MNPGFVEALYNRSLAFNALKRYEDALASCDEALRIRPDLAEALGNRGVALEGLERHEEAVASYDKALAIKPDLAEALNNRGLALGHLKRYDDALASFGKALAVKPDYVEARNNLGNALRHLGRLQDAEEMYRQAVALRPDFAELHLNLGIALRDLGRLQEAERSLRQALALKPGFLEAHNALGHVLFYLERLEEAERSFRETLALSPDCAEAYAFWVHLCQHLCAFPEITRHADALRRLVAERKSGEVAPFMLLALPDTDAAEQLACARQFADKNYPVYFSRPVLRGSAIHRRHDKLRVGYLSSDYFEHATSYLLAEVIELHDRSRFEVTGYSYGPDDGSPMRERMRAAFDKFHDIRGFSHERAAQQLLGDEIDILVDLKGYTGSNRVQISALRPTPVQASWLGYPGTLGDPRLADYLIGDPIVTPLEHSAHYDEALVLMPNCYQPNDRQRSVGARPLKAEAGLPDTGFVFCCFNQSYKITPAMFDLWCRLLTNVPGSVLWLLQTNAVALGNLRREALGRGVAPDRLIFAPALPQHLHLARLQLADLALDTFPVTSHTTASDALWVGLPLITCIGETFVSRVAASILHAAGMQELVTQTFDSCYQTALDIARNPERVSSLKTRLAANRSTCALFDSNRFSRDLERAYEHMWANHRAGKREPIVLRNR